MRTDKPEAEIGVYKDTQQLDYVQWQAYAQWQADRQLAETIHTKLKALLDAQSLELSDVQAIVVFKGPGSFTGLRIGISVANALADGLAIPIIGTTGADWIARGIEMLGKGENEHIVLPEYGSPPHITKPKK
jgi:tRNA threonylcarbamoyladenosine biosynthesis protein TsaB